MNLNEIVSAIESMSGERDYNVYTVQDVNVCRSVADYFIYGNVNYKSFDAFDMGIRIAVKYISVIRNVIDRRIVESLGASAHTFYDYFNRNMDFVDTGKSTGRNVVWDGIIANSIRDNLKTTKVKLAGNIGTTVMATATQSDPSITPSGSSMLKQLNTKPLSMTDTQLVMRWIEWPGGLVEMLMFIARMVELSFHFREKNI